jgi:hypothetical protein
MDKIGGLNNTVNNNTRHASPLDAHLGGFFYGCKKKRPQKGRRPGDAIAGGAMFCEILALK